jgi:hypothetical protein
VTKNARNSSADARKILARTGCTDFLGQGAMVLSPSLAIRTVAQWHVDALTP